MKGDFVLPSWEYILGGMPLGKKWEELNLADNYIFQKVMLNEKLCKKILSEIIGKEVVKIDYTAYEKTIEIRGDAKGIRLDVYVKDEEDVVYNVEVQNTENDNLPKRSRYYHDLIDLDLLEKGNEYEALNHSYVIFICTFDIFKKGYYKYVFTANSYNNSSENIELEDGTTTIFLNSKGSRGEVSNALKEFLNCINGEFTNGEFSAILKKEVKSIKDSKKWRKEYMYMELLLRDEKRAARKEGLAEGRAEGRAEGLTEGLLEGRVEGSKLINQLNHKLIMDGRLDDLKKSVEDEEYQQSLLKEYSLI